MSEDSAALPEREYMEYDVLIVGGGPAGRGGDGTGP